MIDTMTEPHLTARQARTTYSVSGLRVLLCMALLLAGLQPVRAYDTIDEFLENDPGPPPNPITNIYLQRVIKGHRYFNNCNKNACSAQQNYDKTKPILDRTGKNLSTFPKL